MEYYIFTSKFSIIIFRESDIISLHCPLTEETRGLIGQEAFDRMDKYVFNA